ncbi:MAG TPA: sulfite exporter TauE/SafE family protein [Gaiellaceae bacterium]|nr:sulfite exporter TauE/SafE family protein [Gaiellaceae bacterium]
MKRLAFLVAVAGALMVPALAAAHPLGNFTINRFSRVEASGHRLYVRYVLDLAEIPTFQAGHIDARAYARRIARNAQLVVNGRAGRLVPLGTALAHPRGAAGLRTTRLEVILAGPTLNDGVSISYQDDNYKDRIGWKEIVIGPKAHSTSDELRAYPKNLLQSPLDITSVRTQLAPTNGPDVPPTLSSGKTLEAPDRVADAGFSSLIGRDHLSALVILASLAAAFFWGMAHALSPGHGKTIVAAYLVGQRGTPWHAAALGAIVTATHTIGVFALGLVTLALSAFIVPEQLYPWLNLVSGVLVVAIGATVFRSRFRHRGHTHDHGHHHHHHEHEAPTRRSLVAVGITGGLLPCPSALVVLLAAISLHRVAFGMLLIVAFSAGLALSITGIGLVAVYAKQIFKRASFEGRLVRLLPAASALVILAAGLAMTVRALPKVS